MSNEITGFSPIQQPTGHQTIPDGKSGVDGLDPILGKDGINGKDGVNEPGNKQLENIENNYHPCPKPED